MALAPANSIPAFIIDNAQVRYGLALPLFCGIDPGNALSRVRIADHRGAVVHQLAHVDFVAQDSVAAHGIAVDGADVPASTGRGGHAFGIQPARDRERRFAGDVFGVDPPHDFGLVGIDLAQAAFRFTAGVQAVHFAVAIDDVARGAAGGHAPALAALDLVGQILAEQAGHRALEADLQFVHLSFGQGEDPRAKKANALVNAGEIFLIA
nr:hypothetical protein [Novosphingobium clariflavum]